MDKILEGRTGVVFGVANKRSISWACAKALSEAGMRLALTYVGNRLEGTVRKLADELPDSLVLPCDVTEDSAVRETFDAIGSEFGHLDAVLHGIAYAKREELQGELCDTSKEGYMLAHDVSAYSLIAIAKAAYPLMEGRQGAMVTLSYIGGERVIPNYNVMGVAKAALESCVRYLSCDLGSRGIRINAISAGPIRTLSASAVGNFSSMLDHIAERAPLRRNITAREVADTCVFLCSPFSSGITGTTLYVDGGYHVMGV